MIFHFSLPCILALLSVLQPPLPSALLCDPGSATSTGHITWLSCPLASGWVWPMGVSGRNEKEERKTGQKKSPDKAHMGGNQLMLLSHTDLFPSLSLLLSLKSINISSGEDF